MKRILSLFLTVIMLFAFVSCNRELIPRGTETMKPEATDSITDDDKSDTSVNVPKYTGMTVSNKMPTAQVLTNNNVSLLTNYINQNDPFGKNDGGKHLEELLKEEFSDTTAVSGGYYANKNSDVYILVHIENPGEYVIQSVKLNGKTFSSYMFESGSNMETLILKCNVGEGAETRDYTIDSIKYLDGDNAKDVIIEGEKTVTVNVISNNHPTASVISENVAGNSITVTAEITDDQKLISKNGNELYLVVYDGNKLVNVVEYNVGEPRTVEGLEGTTVYQYAIVAIYDAADGEGRTVHILLKKAIQTNIYISPQPSLDSTKNWSQLDFEGENINILVREDIKVSREWESEVIDDDDELEMAIAARNEVVESDLNVNVNMIYVTGPLSWVGGGDYDSTFMPKVMQDINNDLHEIDISANFGYKAMNASYRDCWANLLDKDVFPYFDFDLPCWNQSLVKNGTVNGQLYLCAGDLNLSMFDSAMIMWHNKDLYEEIRKDDDPEDIQDVAIAGEWTYSELYKWSQYYDDVDPTSNKGDVFGLKMNGCTWPTQPMLALPYAWDIHFMTQNSDGTWEYDLVGNARAEQGLIAIRNLFVQRGVANELTGAGSFVSGNILFEGSIIYWDKESNLAIRNMEDKYALLPWPKFDETQDHYATTSQDYLTMVTILDHSCSNVPTKGEAISAYLQYANEYSNQNVRGYYFERIIMPKFFGTDDSDGHVTKSIAIFYTIIDNLEYDFATIYTSMLGGVVRTCWTYNVVDSTGKPYSDTVLKKFSENRTMYEERLEDLNRWFGLID